MGVELSWGDHLTQHPTALQTGDLRGDRSDPPPPPPSLSITPRRVTPVVGRGGRGRGEEGSPLKFSDFGSVLSVVRRDSHCAQELRKRGTYAVNPRPRALSLFPSRRVAPLGVEGEERVFTA